MIDRGKSNWEGTCPEGEYWFVEVELDRFSDIEPHVVSLFVKYDENRANPESTIHDALATLTPEQAREVAQTLVRTADAVERANRRASL